MSGVAVIAHRGKTLGGGLPELRRVLERRGVTDVFWREVGKSRFAPAEVRKALAHDADLIFIWGGDGMVQRCVDVVGRVRRGRRDRPRRDGEPAGHESRHSEGHRAGCRDRTVRPLASHRRRADQRRALRRDGRRGPRRAHDRRRRRRPEGPLRPAGLCLDGRQAPAREAVPREDQGGWRALVRRGGELHPARQCRQALRRRRGVRGRTPGRRRAGARRRLGGRRAGNGRARLLVRWSAPPPSRRTRSPRRCIRCASSSIARCCTRSTAATARRCGRLRVEVEPEAVQICVPVDAGPAITSESAPA